MPARYPLKSNQSIYRFLGDGLILFLGLDRKSEYKKLVEEIFAADGLEKKKLPYNSNWK